MDYNININKICRICLEEGVLTSIFNTEFAMMPADMLMLCAKIKVQVTILINKLLVVNSVDCRYTKTMGCHQWYATTASIVSEPHIISSNNVKIPTLDYDNIWDFWIKDTGISNCINWRLPNSLNNLFSASEIMRQWLMKLC